MEYKNHFENLNVWKMAREIRIEISRLILRYPVHERYELCNQTIRAARSVGANIAEGHGRYHYLENVRFCRIARGSLMELLDHLIVAKDEAYISTDDFNCLSEKIMLNVKVLNGYIAYLKRRKVQNNPSEDKSFIQNSYQELAELNAGIHNSNFHNNTIS